MDLSSLLSKKLEQKRHRKLKGNAKSPSGVIPEKDVTSHGNSTANNTTNNEHTTSGSTQNDTKTTEQSQILHSIDEKKLSEGLRLFNETGMSQSKEEQLRKLQIHVKHEKKDLRYKAYLDAENGVPVAIQLADIAAQNSNKLRLQIRRFFKEILQTWSSSCDHEFPESILSETKRDIVKLLYKLRSDKLPAETVVSLSTIVYYIQTENIVKANEAYLKLSIGNVAWPIGVRDVSIHARSADAKIAGDDKTQLSNIMKSEATRRWLIAVKRIVNYCERLHAKQRGGV